jgi:hypothetical protein
MESITSDTSGAEESTCGPPARTHQSSRKRCNLRRSGTHRSFVDHLPGCCLKRSPSACTLHTTVTSSSSFSTTSGLLAASGASKAANTKKAAHRPQAPPPTGNTHGLVPGAWACAALVVRMVAGLVNIRLRYSLVHAISAAATSVERARRKCGARPVRSNGTKHFPHFFTSKYLALPPFHERGKSPKDNQPNFQGFIFSFRGIERMY